MTDGKKKRGPGNPSKPKLGPRFDKRKDLPDPSKPECGHKWRDGHGIWQTCRKRGYHWKHGKG